MCRQSLLYIYWSVDYDLQAYIFAVKYVDSVVGEGFCESCCQDKQRLQEQLRYLEQEEATSQMHYCYYSSSLFRVL